MLHSTASPIIHDATLVIFGYDIVFNNIIRVIKKCETFIMLYDNLFCNKIGINRGDIFHVQIRTFITINIQHQHSIIQSGPSTSRDSKKTNIHLGE